MLNTPKVGNLNCSLKSYFNSEIAVKTIVKHKYKTLFDINKNKIPLYFIAHNCKFAAMNSSKENRKLKLWELSRVTPEEFSVQDKFPIVVVLDNIRSLNNIGSFFRTCDAFNVQHLYLCGITATPPHRDINKTAIGATNSVSWSHEKSTIELLEKLRADGYTICTVEQAEKTELLQNIQTWKEKKFALIFGNEVDGVDQQLIDASDYVVEIPQFGTKHSLNVSVCAGVVLWEFAKKFIPE